MRLRIASFLSIGLLSAATAARAGNPRLAPIPREQASSTHGPFESGACDTCHEQADPKNPGAAVKASNDLCFECHDEFKGKTQVKMDRALHPAAKATSCTTCHSPHNSKKRKLLL
jgi:predicted CXXCH cytochrome family protein